MITDTSYYFEKIQILRDLFVSSKFSNRDIYELNECLNFFQNEFLCLDERTKGILVSEITRITNVLFQIMMFVQPFVLQKIN